MAHIQHLVSLGGGFEDTHIGEQVVFNRHCYLTQNVSSASLGTINSYWGNKNSAGKIFFPVHDSLFLIRSGVLT
jgi:hypothetical protein